MPSRSIAQLSVLLQSGTLDPVDLAEETLAGIAAHPDKAIFTSVTAARARAEAQAARKRFREGRSLGVLDGVPRSADAHATRKTELWRVDAKLVHDALTEEPGSALALLGVFARRIRDTDALVERNSSMDLGKRLARLLLEEGASGKIIYNQSDLAHLVGATREAVNRKRVRRLIRVMGLEAIDPEPRTAVPAPGHRVYPYLFRGVAVERPGHVWSADSTYLPLPSGFMYLAATIDWYSRLVVAWRLSNTLDGAFCLDMLEVALATGTPEVFNTDQGVQFTAQAWTGRLESAGVAVSMDGRGRCLDNVFVERLWRTVKYEDIYLWRYDGVPELRRGLGRYFPYYNRKRPHQALAYRTPAEVYREGRKRMPGSRRPGVEVQQRCRRAESSGTVAKESTFLV